MSADTSIHAPHSMPSPAAFEPGLIAYHIPWRSHAFHAGASLTAHQGSGSDFAGFSPLLACPDPRRVDVRASLRTVPRQWLVRTYLERAAIQLHAIVDVSSSMFFQGSAHMQQQVTALVAALAWSATRQGDAFALSAADDQLQPSLQLQPSFQPATAQTVAQALTRFWQDAAWSQGKTAAALPKAMATVRPKRALVFLISDFYWSEALLKQTLQSASAHDVVPVVLRDQSATVSLPAFGWARLRDMETGGERSWLLRPSLHRQIAAHAAAQRAALNVSLQQAGTRAPLWLQPGWRVEDVSQHLMESLS